MSSCTGTLFSSPFLPLSSPSSSLKDNLEDPLEIISSNGMRDARRNEAMRMRDEFLLNEDPLHQQEQANDDIDPSFSCRNADDCQFQLLTNFLSANEDCISKYLFE